MDRITAETRIEDLKGLYDLAGKYHTPERIAAVVKATEGMSPINFIDACRSIHNDIMAGKDFPKNLVNELIKFKTKESNKSDNFICPDCENDGRIFIRDLQSDNMYQQAGTNIACTCSYGQKYQWMNKKEVNPNDPLDDLVRRYLKGEIDKNGRPTSQSHILV